MFNFPPYTFLLVAFFPFQVERKLVKAQIIFKRNFIESKAIDKFFFRLFFDLISAFNFQQTLSSGYNT
jgi:hypothetical protein